MRVTVWNEYGEDGRRPDVKRVYPEGIHMALKRALEEERDFQVTVCTQEMPGQGLNAEILENTDVLLWWGHCYHHLVDDEVVRRVVDRVQRGMGIIFLHSAHFSKPFRALMGTSCTLKWREDGERERLWNLAPRHPITQGVAESFVIPHEEMYGERFDIPEPDEVIFLGWFPGGEVFRSGCTYQRGLGRVFYFQPGHETYPVYLQPEIKTVLKNAVRWAAPEHILDRLECPCTPPREELK